MSEQHREQIETPEQKRERLLPIFQWSLDVINNPDTKSLWEGEITVTQRRPSTGEVITSSGVVVWEDIDDSGVTLCNIEEDDGPGMSFWIKWESLIDAQKVE